MLVVFIHQRMSQFTKGGPISHLETHLEPSALVLNLSPLALIGSLSIQYDLDKEGEGP